MAEVSVQFLRMNLSSRSKSLGAMKKKSQSGHRSLMKEMLRFLVWPLWPSVPAWEPSMA